MMIMVKMISRDNAPIITAPSMLFIGLLSTPFLPSVKKIGIFILEICVDCKIIFLDTVV